MIDVQCPACAQVLGSDSRELDTRVEELKGLFSPMAMRRLPRYVKAALLASHKVLLAAHCLPLTNAFSASTGLIIATAYGCKTMSCHFMDSILDNSPRLASPSAFSHSVNNVAGGLISMQLKLYGPNITISQFELSLAGAFQAATVLLATHKTRHMLVIVADEEDDRFSACCQNSDTLTGAVTFLLTQEDTAAPRLHVEWQASIPANAADVPSPRSALPHAVALSHALLHRPNESFCCEQYSTIYQRTARIIHF